MADFFSPPNEQAAHQLCDDLAALDGGPRQEPVDFDSIHPSVRGRARQLYASGQLARTTGVTVPMFAEGGELLVKIPDDTATKLAEDDARPGGAKRLNAAARARVVAALAAKAPRPLGQVMRAR